ncbi:hypothetical protein TIFTF001_025614 [Ficus carica]|uniref:Uncharacterized protein n=1 Tax=Ficus carica TaxID=3494 RepID=A0AA88AR94_FICCA|nr:hypothetical protein TIFTF001_025614 [Ficus carica]
MLDLPGTRGGEAFECPSTSLFVFLIHHKPLSPFLGTNEGHVPSDFVQRACTSYHQAFQWGCSSTARCVCIGVGGHGVQHVVEPQKGNATEFGSRRARDSLQGHQTLESNSSPYKAVKGTGPSGSGGGSGDECLAEDMVLWELGPGASCVCDRRLFTAGVLYGMDSGCNGATGL